MDDEHHDGLMSFATAAMIVPRSVLQQAVDTKRLRLYRRGRTLPLAREDVLALREQTSSSRDMSIVNEER